MEHANMLAVWGITGGKVCDTGCHAFNGGKCQSYKKLVAVTSVLKKLNQAESNKLFSRNSNSFIAACEAAETNPTPRQASKFRNGKGIAYKTMMKNRNKAVQP
jgi:hypothetical protein